MILRVSERYQLLPEDNVFYDTRGPGCWQDSECWAFELLAAAVQVWRAGGEGGGLAALPTVPQTVDAMPTLPPVTDSQRARACYTSAW